MKYIKDFNDFPHIKAQDKTLHKYLEQEYNRQLSGIELIASENYVSPAILEAMGSVLTNKYSEGYPKARYYGGNQFIDKIEELAIKRAKKAFKVKYVNVQPYSGSPANLAVHFALLKVGDKTMGMQLSSGGHLTHGYKVSFSGIYYKSKNYPVGEDGYIDYDLVEELAIKWKPKLIWAGASAYPRFIDYKRFREIADKVGAYLAVDIAHVAGLIVAGEHPSPVEYAHVVTTTTHKTLRGPRGAMIMTNNKEIAEKINKAIFPGLQGGPHNHITAAIAVALKEALSPKFKEYGAQVVKNAKALAKYLQKGGLKIITDGTDNHLMLVDVTPLGITGKIAEKTLEKVDISVNKNTIPHDPRKPWDPSGIRIGTPAITTRGLKEKHMKQVAEFIIEALKNYDNNTSLKNIKQSVNGFALQFDLFSKEWLIQET